MPSLCLQDGGAGMSPRIHMISAVTNDIREMMLAKLYQGRVKRATAGGHLQEHLQLLQEAINAGNRAHGRRYLAFARRNKGFGGSSPSALIHRSKSEHCHLAQFLRNVPCTQTGTSDGFSILAKSCSSSTTPCTECP